MHSSPKSSTLKGNVPGTDLGCATPIHFEKVTGIKPKFTSFFSTLSAAISGGPNGSQGNEVWQDFPVASSQQAQQADTSESEADRESFCSPVPQQYVEDSHIAEHRDNIALEDSPLRPEISAELDSAKPSRGGMDHPASIVAPQQSESVSKTLECELSDSPDRSGRGYRPAEPCHRVDEELTTPATEQAFERISSISQLDPEDCNKAEGTLRISCHHVSQSSILHNDQSDHSEPVYEPSSESDDSPMVPQSTVRKGFRRVVPSDDDEPDIDAYPYFTAKTQVEESSPSVTQAFRSPLRDRTPK